MLLIDTCLWVSKICIYLLKLISPNNHLATTAQELILDIIHAISIITWEHKSRISRRY